MPDISNNPIATTAMAAAEGARRDTELQQASRQRAGAVTDVVQAAVTGASQDRGTPSANGLDPTQRVSDVSVSAEARQRLAAEGTAQAPQTNVGPAGNALQQRINDLLGGPSSTAAPEATVPTDVSGGRGVSGGEARRAGSLPGGATQQPGQAASSTAPSSADPAAARVQSSTSAGPQSSVQANTDLTGNPGRIQRA